jgi:hypothetical protein
VTHSSVRISSAGNTDNPALFVLRTKGYVLEIKCYSNGRCFYFASKDDRTFVGDSGPEVLGLVAMWEYFGDNWREKLSSIPDIMGEVVTEVGEGEDGEEIRDSES